MTDKDINKILIENIYLKEYIECVHKIITVQQFSDIFQKFNERKKKIEKDIEEHEKREKRCI